MNYLKYLREKFSSVYNFDMFLSKFREQFGSNPRYEDIAHYIVGSNQGGWEQEIMTTHVVFHCLQYIGLGEPLFEIKHGLACLLLDTELSKVHKDMIKMPFREIHLELPYGIFKTFDDREKPFNVMSIFIHYDPEVSSKMRILGNFDPQDKSQPFDDLNHFYVLDFNEGETVDEILDYRMRQEMPIENKELTEHSPEFVARFKAYMRESFAFIINCLLYINSIHADIRREDRGTDLRRKLARAKSPGKKKEIQRSIDNAGKSKYIVGGSITLTKEETSYYAERTPDGTGTKHSHRYRVRGHYKEQAIGVEFKNHRLKWINPYFRGPELAELISKKYIVK